MPLYSLYLIYLRTIQLMCSVDFYFSFYFSTAWLIFIFFCTWTNLNNRNKSKHLEWRMVMHSVEPCTWQKHSSNLKFGNLISHHSLPVLESFIALQSTETLPRQPTPYLKCIYNRGVCFLCVACTNPTMQMLNAPSFVKI